MRRRLINSTLAVVLVVIAVFGVSLVIVETRTITSSAQDRIGSEALRLLGTVEADALEHKPVDPTALAEQLDLGTYARISIPGRPVVEVGDRIPDSVIRGTARGEQGEVVTVEESRATVTREVGRTLAVVGAVALLAVVAAVLLAVRQANRLASPSPTSPRRPSGWDRATRGPGTSATGSPSWTGSPTCSTPARSASAGCSRPSAGSPRTPPTSCGPR